MRSAKQLQAIAKPPKRGKIKQWAKKRKAKEFARCYHSVERVEFVKSLPCSACGVVGYSQNAHVLGNDGMGRKKGYETIAPLCGPRPHRLAVGRPLAPGIVAFMGCHRLYDEYHWDLEAEFRDFDPVRAAAETEKLWQAHTRAPREET